MNKGKEGILKNMWKRAVLASLVLAMVVFMVPLTVDAGEVTSGTLEGAEGIAWTYDGETETLILTGDSGENAKWDKLKKIADGKFKHIVVKDCTLRGSLIYMFSDLEEVESIRFINVDTSNVTNMGGMFLFCSSLKELDINCFNTSKVTNMGSLFSGCSSLETLDVSSLQTDNVTNMAGMFSDCSGLKTIDVSGFNTANARDMQSIFEGCNSLTELDLSNFDMSWVVVEWQMFDECSNLQKLHTPKNLKKDFWLKLPHEFYTSDGEKVTVLTPKYQNTLLTVEKNPFADVKMDSWQYVYAKFAVENNLMSGKGNDESGKIKFDPNNKMTRAEFVQTLYNKEGKPAVTFRDKFTDVKSKDWFASAIIWASDNNIVSGKGDKFDVSGNIARQEIAVILYKYAKYLNYDVSGTADLEPYADDEKVASWAKEAMQWAIANGIMSGKGNKGEDISTFKLDPIGDATRAECAAMLKNFMEAY